MSQRRIIRYTYLTIQDNIRTSVLIIVKIDGKL